MASRGTHFSLLPSLLIQLLFSLLIPVHCQHASAQGLTPSATPIPQKPVLRAPALPPQAPVAAEPDTDSASTRQVAILGHVRQPGVFAISNGQLRLPEALALASGLQATASGTLRIVRDGQPVISTDLSAERTGIPISLRDGDVLIADGLADAPSADPHSPQGNSATLTADLPCCVAVLNLLPRPVIMPVRDEAQTVAAVMEDLRQPPGAVASVIPAAHRHISQNVSATELLDWRLAAGDVLVLDPALVDAGRVPGDLPPVLRRNFGRPPVTVFPAPPLSPTSVTPSAVAQNADSGDNSVSDSANTFDVSETRIVAGAGTAAAPAELPSDADEFIRASVAIGIICVVLAATILWWKCSWGEQVEGASLGTISKTISKAISNSSPSDAGPNPPPTADSTRAAQLEALRRLHRQPSVTGLTGPTSTRQDAPHSTPDASARTAGARSRGQTGHQTPDEHAAPGLLDRALARVQKKRT